MYFIASSFSEWSLIRQTGSDKIDSSAQTADDSFDLAAQRSMRGAIHVEVSQLPACAGRVGGGQLGARLLVARRSVVQHEHADSVSFRHAVGLPSTAAVKRDAPIIADA
jgi:hypothetical protein